jgi:hypothetical protein
MLFLYQLNLYRTTGMWQEALDSPMNGVYGLSVAIWATLFVISWKRKQKMI